MRVAVVVPLALRRLAAASARDTMRENRSTSAATAAVRDTCGSTGPSSCGSTGTTQPLNPKQPGQLRPNRRRSPATAAQPQRSATPRRLRQHQTRSGDQREDLRLITAHSRHPVTPEATRARHASATPSAETSPALTPRVSAHVTEEGAGRIIRSVWLGEEWGERVADAGESFVVAGEET
jgi:hypothetical protein